MYVFENGGSLNGNKEWREKELSLGVYPALFYTVMLLEGYICRVRSVR